MTVKHKRTILSIFCGFFIVVFIVVLGVSAKTHSDAQALLEDSVCKQLISASAAAREIIDVDQFLSYDDESMFEDPKYIATVLRLRDLQKQVGAMYIYALRMIDGEAMFIYDTDPEATFDAYELSSVHVDAFAGYESASIMNVQDEWGSFNTGAVPLYKDGRVVGVVSTDIEDAFIMKSKADNLRNMIIMAGALGLMLIAIIVVLNITLNKLKRVQDELHRMAHYDKLTNLPNRQYLFEQLDTLARKKPRPPFVVFFVDLDNFKLVNDNAGHDAGDELLRHISKYLEQPTENAQVFRPTSGRLNVTARIGGDEFIIVVTKMETAQEAADYARSLLDGFRTEGISRFIDEYNVGLSIGVALFPHHTEDYNVLLKYADIAMYHAKRSGKNQYMVYHENLAPKAEK